MNWDKAKALFSTWGWLILAILGLVALGGAITLALQPGGIDDPIAKQLFSLSYAIIGAGVVAGVLRATQSIGFFQEELRAVLRSDTSIRDELRKVIPSDTFIRDELRQALRSDSLIRDQLREVIYSDDLEGSQINVKESWRNLTRGLLKQRFKALDGDRFGFLDIDQLIGPVDFFYESHRREVVISWSNADRTHIRIVEKVDARLQTAEVGRQIPFVNRYSPDADGSHRILLEYRFCEGFELALSEQDAKTEADGSQEYRALLPHSSRMRLIRRTEKLQRFDHDPFVNFRSNCLWSRPEIMIRCDAPDLGFYFRSLGTSKPFIALGDSDIDGLLRFLNAKCDTLCLPNQGYMLVVVKSAAGAH